jgi:hypothetical protein
MSALLYAPDPQLATTSEDRETERVAHDTYASQFDDDDWSSPFGEPDEASDLDDPTLPETDDDRWDVFLPDEEPYEPRPEPGDFWIDAEEE